MNDGADESADESEGQRPGDVPSTLAHAISGVGAGVQADCSNGVDWNCHVLSSDGCVAEGFGDGWDEIGDGTSAEIEDEEKHECISAGINSSGFEGFPVGKTFVVTAVGFLAVDNDADGCELALFE